MAEVPQTPHDGPTRLDQIETQWSLLRLAHQPVTAAGAARNALVLRYYGAIRAYIGAQVRSPQDAEELTHDMVVRLLGGKFANADRQRGRFRDFLKVAVRNRVKSYWGKQAQGKSADLDVNLLPEDEEGKAPDPPWDDAWQQSVLQLTWKAMEDYERDHPDSVAWTVLRLRADHPEDSATQLADRLARAKGRPFKPDAARQQLHRARLRFAELLIEEVARGLDEPTPARVEEELVELGLMGYVRDLLPDDWRTTGMLRP
jgi:RNA polymerase sigma-70 factor (ECF subfamily)